MVSGTVVASGDGRFHVRLPDGQTISVAAGELPEAARQDGASIGISFGAGHNALAGQARELLNYLLQIS